MSARKLIFISLLLIVFANSVSAIDYYSGNVSVEQIIGYITVKDNQQAQVDLIYTIKNLGSNTLPITISFPSFPEDATYNVSEEKGSELRINLPLGETKFLVSFNQKFDSLSRLSLNPSYNLDGKLPVKKINLQQYTVELKSGELTLLSSDPEMSLIGNSLYNFILGNSYPKKIRLDISSKNIQVSATRTVSGYGQVGDIVNIATTITNIGEGSLSDLRLEDSIFAAYFEPVSEGFTSYSSEQITEPLNIYSSAIPTLSSGESYTLNYSIKVKSMGAPAFTGARILYKGNFLTSTEANSPTIFPIHVNQQRNPVDSNNVQATIKENKLPIELESLNNTFNPNEQEVIFRPEEKEMFNQQVKKDNNKDLLFNIIITLVVLIIIGAGYLVWKNYKEIIIESFSNLDLSSLKFWEKNKDENK